MAKEKLPVNIDISAGAKLNVDVKTEIPKESSGRFLDALTDAIRPFTEKRGLKADQIRLQREEVLIEIAQKAQQRLAFEGVSPKAIPNRVLIPLLEKASLNSLDDEDLVEAWSDILASASNGEGANISIYADILSKMDPQHLSYLEFLVGADDQSGPLDECLRYSKDVLNAKFEKLMRRAREKFPSNSNSDAINDFINSEVSTAFKKHGIKTISGASEFGEISETDSKLFQ